MYKIKKVLRWNKGEPMSSDYALEVVRSVSRFIYKRYHQPNTAAFETETDFKEMLAELEGLEVYIQDGKEKFDLLYELYFQEQHQAFEQSAAVKARLERDETLNLEKWVKYERQCRCLQVFAAVSVAIICCLLWRI